MSGELGTLSREQLIASLRAIPVDQPERFTDGLSDEAIAGVLRRHRHETRQGKRIGSGLVVTWLRNGGLEGYGERVQTVQAWWRTWQGRERWINANVSDLDPVFAETAIISLTQQKREPTVPLVRQWAAKAQADQEAHDEQCRRAMNPEKKTENPVELQKAA